MMSSGRRGCGHWLRMKDGRDAAGYESPGHGKQGSGAGELELGRYTYIIASQSLAFLRLLTRLNRQLTDHRTDARRRSPRLDAGIDDKEDR